MKVFIISYNRLTSLKAMCEYLVKTGAEPIIIDNHSSYMPLRLWFQEGRYKTIILSHNHGHQTLWLHPEIMESVLKDDKYYCVSDPDLDLSSIPHDWIEVLKQGLIENPDVIKSGFSLRIDDLPENEYTKEVIKWEQKYWEREKRGNFFLSEIDTTFAMYHRDRDFGKLPNDRFFSAVRSDKPYEAIHRPWMLTKEMYENSEEEQFYLKNTHTYWAEIFKEKVLNL